MSKQIKYTLIILTALCVISLVGNIWQAANSGPSESVPKDTTEMKAQSELVRKQATEIDSLIQTVNSLKKELNKKKN